ncbi:DsbA family protein [Haladaptatus sp. CMAA 1911]|uniref:DsbA family protein n=1 Tax=unclassified Haladaptatus TaxID=2622732 RepID=UPI003753EFDB
MDRRTLLKTILPASFLLSGCTSQSDKTSTPDTTRSTTTTGGKQNSPKTKTTYTATSTTAIQSAESTTEHRTTTTTQSTTEPETASTTQATTEQPPSTTQATTDEKTSNTVQSTTKTTDEPETTTKIQSKTKQSTNTPQSTTKQKTTKPTQSTTTQKITSSIRTTTTNTRSTPDHPSAKGVFDEPTQGPTPFSTDATLIVFEDPSCPNCVYFENNTYPKLKRNHIDSGTLSFVARTVPVVDKWGSHAIYALEATYARDEQAFWKLKAFYFNNQDQFDAGNVLSKTESFINYNTRLSGRKIIREARSKRYRKQVKEDYSVAKAANIPGTPTFFAFRSDKYVTKIVGRQSYSVFKNILGL